MKRIERYPEKFEVIDIFENMARKKGLKLSEPESHKNFIATLTKSFHESKDNPIIIHGRRIESMFEYLAASLGKAVLIRREDSGEVCSLGPGIRPPDFRIVLDDGTEIFVEVKNCHKIDPNYRYPLKRSYASAIIQLRYFRALHRYELVEVPVTLFSQVHDVGVKHFNADGPTINIPIGKSPPRLYSKIGSI